ncbi:MAG: zinc ribbon domain-containing protein [Candidatus Eremiobacteraeota bacterium]|nr:zinc ribbon domain-containing protein [Candidatus Eremiobacteraeota bacterium]
MYCPKCGAQNDDNSYKCVSCSYLLHAKPARQMPRPIQSDDSLGGLIPYKNPYSLISYYLAVFSLIPGIGLILGSIAFFLGMKGLRFYQEHPESGGKIHSWVGIILGGICGFGSIILVIFIIIMSQQ